MKILIIFVNLIIYGCGNYIPDRPFKIQSNINDIQFNQRLQEAADMWNEAVGVEVVRVVKNSQNNVSINDNMPREVLGYASWSEYDCDVSVKSSILLPGITNRKVAILAHEIGHCLGIHEHSKVPKDLMYPMLWWGNLVPSPNDVQKIKDLMGIGIQPGGIGGF